MKPRRATLVAFVVLIIASLILSSALNGIAFSGKMGQNGSSLFSASEITGHPIVNQSGFMGNKYGVSENAFSTLSNDSIQLISMGTSSKISSIAASATPYSTTFTVSNKASGVQWSVYVYSSLALSIPDLPLYNSLYHQNYGLIFSDSVTTSSIKASLASGTYYYYAGPSSALTGPYKLTVSGSQYVSITFPTFYTASFSESGLISGSSWSIYGTANLANGMVTILSENSTSSTISVSAPDGYYDFAFGVGSTVIESYSSLISGSNVSRQINIPTLYKITFQESGLAAGTSWRIYGETTVQNQYSFNTFFDLSSTSASVTVEVPDGVYYYQSTVDNTTRTAASLIYVDGVGQTLSVNFSGMYSIVFDESGFTPGVQWQVSAYSTNGTISSTGHSSSAALSLELPSGSYTYTAGEGGANFLNGNFSVSTSGVSVALTSPQLYGVNISESGLFEGMNWGVTIYGSGHVTVFSNNSLGPYLATYLPAGKYSYTVTESTINTVLYQQTQSVYASSSFTVGSTKVSVSVSFPKLVATTFVESNLKSGLTWGAGVYSSASATGFSEVYYNTSSTYSSVTSYLINGTFSYSIEGAGSYFYPSSSTFKVAGVKQTIGYNFPALYKTSFSIIGLKSSNTWTLTVDESSYSVVFTNSSSFASMVAYLPNGSYNYAVGTSSHLAATSSFSVSGAALNVPITIAASYTIVFRETGLPSGILWYVSLNGTYSFSSNSTIQFSEPNGTYQYSVVSSSYNATPSSGTVDVVGTTITVTVVFRQTQATFSITFAETGLSAGTPWSVLIANSTVSSVRGSIVVQEPNGSYVYEINASGYTPTPSSGLVTVRGTGQTVSISFAVAVPVTRYGISFRETGLPADTNWTVSLTNSTGAGKVVGTISTANESVQAYGITYDSSNRYLYVSGFVQNSTSANKYPGVVLVISPVTNTIITTISVGTLPETSAFDPYNGYLYVANSLSDNVSVINTATQTVIATIPVGSEPVGIAYSSVNNDIYVANGASGTVSVIGSTSNTVLTTITVGASGETLAGAVFDPSNGDVYVGGFNAVSSTDSVFVISSSANTVIDEISGSAYFGAYDSLNGYLYFTDNALNSVLVVDGATNSVVTTIELPAHSSPVGIAYDSYDHNVYVAERNSSSLSVISSLTNTVVATLDVTGSPLFPAYVPTNHYIYLSNHLANGVQIVHSYGGASTVKSSTVSSIQFSEPNGTYSFSVGSINRYSVSSQSGTFTINGSSVTETIAFTKVSGYEVTFSETGLRSGTSWAVTLGAGKLTSTSPTISFAETNGSYTYQISNVSGYIVSPTSGVVMVSGSSITEVVTFSQMYSIDFVESNLPAGATWTVVLNGTTESSTNDTITFTELNGSYSFSISSSTNLTASPSTGTIFVSGASITQTTNFSSSSPPVRELYLTGTISPSNATLYVNGLRVDTVNGAFNVSVQAGSYEIKVIATGYKTYYSNITVASNQTHVSSLSIKLSKETTPSPISPVDIIIIVIVAIALVAAVSILLMRSRNRSKSGHN